MPARQAGQLHRRQFVLGPEPWRALDDWMCHQLSESLWLSHCPALRARFRRDADGADWALLGLAVETRDDRDAPAAEIATMRSDEVPARYESWCGRWVLAGQGGLHMDAAGLLGCFFGEDSGGRTIASSSPALLAQLLGGDNRFEPKPRRLGYEQGISWFAPPCSRFAGIRRLLASQVLESDGGRVRPRPLTPAIDRTRPSEETLALVETSLATALKRLTAEHGELWLGLTAGFDSRVILAVAWRAGVPVKPFTRVSARMSIADRVLPPKLARECGYDHVFLHGTKQAGDRAALVEEHTAAHVSAGDVEPFVRGARDTLSGISVGGHGFSVGGGFANLRALPSTVDDPADGARQVAQLFGEPTDSDATEGVCKWLEWVLDHPQEDLDWRDRFYIEQRMGGWLSSKEQVYDMALLERLPLLNAARTYSLLLGLDEERRLESGAQVEMLERLAPHLLRYPLNPPDSEFGTYRRLRKRLARR